MQHSAIYVHIPFCDHKCIYCDFYSIITSDNIDNFIRTVLKEIKTYSSLYSQDKIYSSIFFGGGTPSLLSPGYINKIIDGLRSSFKITNDAEITLETNPGTVEKNKLIQFRQAGINRISIGIQSFDDDDLKFLTRIHDRQTAVDTVANAYDSGFGNISLDLIFNLPGQTKQKWISNLETAVSLPINHISTYSLILERGTILNKMVLNGKVKIQDDDFDADLYETTIDFLTSRSFIQYEVSNFAQPGFECIHNNAYWRYRDYLSFGPSAHSFVNGKRWWNFSSLKKYIYEINLNGTAAAGSEVVNDEQKFSEYIMLALRSSGIDLPELKKLFGVGWFESKSEFINELVQNKLVSLESNRIKLTKSGYAVCDEILARIL